MCVMITAALICSCRGRTVRNSWNTDWGEKGYIRFSMGNNACGLADQPVFADFPQQH